MSVDINTSIKVLLQAWDTCQPVGFYMEQLRDSLIASENNMIVREGKNRFDLEQEIMDCWNVTKDLDTILSVFDRTYTEDELMNMLIGMRDLYNQKFQVLFDTFETCLKKSELK